MNTVALGEGRVCKFRYNDKWRIALVIETDNDHLTCWEFTADGYRSFFDYKMSDIEDVTSMVSMSTDLDKTFNDGRVHSYIHNGVLYSVRF